MATSRLHTVDAHCYDTVPMSLQLFLSIKAADMLIMV